MKSLKHRIIVTFVVLVAVVGIVNACASYWLARRHIGELLDVHLQGAAVWLSAGKVGAIGTQGPPQHSIDGFVGQIWQAGLAKPTDNTDPTVLFNRHAPEGFSFEWIHGIRYRIYTLVNGTEGLTYQVGQPVAFREETAGRTALESVLPTFILIPLVWIAIPLIVNAAFASLARASTEAEAVGIGRLAPLDISDVPEEVRPFTDSINRMIARLRVGIDSEKRFIADAAHELRTPATSLQLRIGNLEAASDEAARTDRLRELRDAVSRMVGMIHQLLSLARADAPLALDGPIETVDVRQLVQGLVADLLPVADVREIDFGVQRFDTAQVEARENDLRMAVRNLMENALRYTPSGGCVDIDVGDVPEGVMVRVSDTGPGISLEARGKVFDRFFRLQTDSEGSGLGLSIVKSVVEKYHGTITLDDRADGRSGLVATLTLPARRSKAG